MDFTETIINGNGHVGSIRVISMENKRGEMSSNFDKSKERTTLYSKLWK